MELYSDQKNSIPEDASHTLGIFSTRKFLNVLHKSYLFGDTIEFIY